jgi:hypothetical protein
MTAGEISGTGPRYYAEPRTYRRQREDFYTEPAWTVELLLDAEDFSGFVWDPACGAGTIPQACERRGLRAGGTDIAKRPYGSRHDFLGDRTPPWDAVANIVCNPPYRLAEAFIGRALSIADSKVAMLVQAKFPYSQRRHALFTARPPTRLYFLSTRPSMPPGDQLLAGTVRPAGGKLDYLWMVWDAARRGGPTECRWLRRPARGTGGRSPGLTAAGDEAGKFDGMGE